MLNRNPTVGFNIRRQNAQETLRQHVIKIMYIWCSMDVLSASIPKNQCIFAYDIITNKLRSSRANWSARVEYL